jgi:branched-chain amino acid transport system substrate-binding protein
MHWKAHYQNAFHEATLRAEDHQLIQPLYLMQMQRADSGGIRFDNEGSGFGFRTERFIPAEQTAAEHVPDAAPPR